MTDRPTDELKLKMHPEVVAHIQQSSKLSGCDSVGDYIETIYRAFLLGRRENAEITATLKGVNALMERSSEERRINAEWREKMGG